MEEEGELDMGVLDATLNEMLKEVRIEAEKMLASLHETEQIINVKATGLLQVLFPVFVAVFGFLIVKMTNNEIDRIFLVGSIFEIIVFLSCFYLFQVLYVYTFIHKGSRPSKELYAELLSDDEYKTMNQFLKNKVYSLNNAN